MATTTSPARNTAIEPAALERMLSDSPSPLVLDVRTGAEFEAIHIAGSYNVPLDRIGDHASEIADLVADRQAPLVLVCRSGARAQQASATLADAGTQDLHLLDGGIDAWQNAGGATASTGNQTWALDRQVRLVAGSISLAGIAASVFVPRAKWLAGAVASGLTFSAVSDTCAMGNVLARLPYNQPNGVNTEDVIRELRDGSSH